MLNESVPMLTLYRAALAAALAPTKDTHGQLQAIPALAGTTSATCSAVH